MLFNRLSKLRQLANVPTKYIYEIIGKTHKPAIPGSSSATLFYGSLEFKSSATLVNRQLVCLRPVVHFDLYICLLGPTRLFAINTAKSK